MKRHTLKHAQIKLLASDLKRAHGRCT